MIRIQRSLRRLSFAAILVGFVALPGAAMAGHHEASETANPCAENPCNPCGDNPCGDNPCGENPCGDNPCGDNPCGDNPCGE